MIILSTGISLFENCIAKWGESSASELFDYAVSYQWESCNELSVLKKLNISSTCKIHILLPSIEHNISSSYAIATYLEYHGFCNVFCHQIPIGEGKSAISRQNAFLLYHNAVTDIIRQSLNSMYEVISFDDHTLLAFAVILSAIVLDAPVSRYDNICKSVVKIPKIPVSYNFRLFEKWQHCISALVGQKHSVLKSSDLPEALHYIFTASKVDGLVMSPIGAAMNALSRIRTAEDLIISRVKSHATLFGACAAVRLSEVPSEPFRKLAAMIKRLCPFVSEIVFSEFDFHTSDPTGYAEYLNSGSGWLKYAFTLPEGRQLVRLLVPFEQEKRARESIGSKIVL